MKKLLSLVLSVSIFISSVTPALGQALGRVPGVVTKLPRVGASQFSTNLSRQILTKTSRASSALRSVNFYQGQLKNVRMTLRVPQANISSFLATAHKVPSAQPIVNVRKAFTNASLVGLMGTPAQASILLDFYKQAQGTLFEDTAALVTARGLLRMQAYTQLGAFLAQNAEKPILGGVAAYAQARNLPVEIPAALKTATVPEANASLASFLGEGFLPGRLHADPSLKATELWMDATLPQERPLVQPEFVEAARPSSATSGKADGLNDPKQAETSPAQAALSKETTPLQDIHFVVPQPGGFVNPSYIVGSSKPAPATSATTSTRSAVAAAHSHEGVLYSGIPVFALTGGLKRVTAWLKQKFNKEKPAAAPYEEPGLHDSTVRPVYVKSAVPTTAQVDEDLASTFLSDVEMVSVGADGFKLTVEGEDKVEHILHNVDLTLSSSLKNFSSEYNRLALDTNHIFELRNQTLSSKRPDHFYFTLSNKNNEFAQLMEGAGKLGLARPMRIKLQQTASPKKVVTLPVVGTDLQETSVIADVDKALLGDVKETEGGQIVYHNNMFLFRSAEGELSSLENPFIRLPKGESKYWTQILAMHPQTQFRLGVFSTIDKMPPVTYLVPSLQVGLGKTMAPLLHDMAGFEKDTSSHIMFGINNVLPVLMGFVHPLLKKYGEAAVLRAGASLFSLGGIVALSSGLLTGPATNMNNWQIAGFLASSVLIALGTNVTRFVQNLIISANRGIVPQNNSFKKKQTTAQSADVTYTPSHVFKRAKEVLTKKSKESLRDVVYYQRGAMFKNLGTMAFLSLPGLLNWAGKAMFGVELGLTFAVSYIPYTLHSLYTLYRLSKIRYKDAFPLNVTLLRNNLQEAQNAAISKIAEINPAEMNASHPVLQAAAKQLKSAIDALAPVESRKTKKAVDGLTRQYEASAGDALEKQLLAAGRSSQEVIAARRAMQKVFDSIGRRDVKLSQVFKAKGMRPALAAMTLATFGELGFANGMAFAMQDLIADPTKAMGIVGMLIYGCMCAWRIVGNVLSQRMSGGSMYALSSAAGITGTGMMAYAMATGNIGLLLAGAITACFGTSNFFSQMYEYMIGLHPKFKREIALLINYTMPAAAIPVGLMKSHAFESLGIPGLDMILCGAALTASVALTPGMLANSSILRMVKYEWSRLKTAIKNFFHRNGDEPPLLNFDW